jgi:hypothetical protein
VIEPGQICRDLTRKTFRIVIVLGPSLKGGKLRVCRWQPSPNPSFVDGRWSVPCALFEHQLKPFPADFDLSTLRGQVVSAAKRSVTITDGLVRWIIGRASFPHPPPTKVHYVGKARP